MSISFEGVPGAGKTTQIALLKKYLESNGYIVTVSEARNDNKLTATVGRIARKLPLGSRERVLMFWIMRLFHVLFLTHKLNHQGKKEIVIIDRFWGTLIASTSTEIKYFKKDFWDKLGEELNKNVDFTILLNVSYKNSFQRKFSHTVRDPKDFRKLRLRYTRLGKQYGWIVINANRDIAKVFEEIKDIMTARLGQ